MVVPWSPRAKRPPADPRPHPEPGEVPVEAPPMSLALPTFAIFPENEEKDGGDEESVLSWSDTPRRHGATDEATSAPCKRLCDSAACNVWTPPDAAVVHDGRQDPCLALKLGLRHACHGLRHTCTMRDGAGQHDLLCLGSMS